jgi:poly(3-hydroxyalkanoate) synthetase
MTRGLAAMATTPPSSEGWSGWSNGWPISKAGQVEAARIGAALAAGRHPPEAFRAAVTRRLFQADAALISGIAAYRRHPWRRSMPEAPVVWREGGSRLLDYGGEGVPVLVVPSLINRSYVLDLAPGHSMLRHLVARGCRVLLLDWGWPGELERGFTLTDYIAGRLERALCSAPAAALGRVGLVGYCMGGLLALAAALRRPERVRGLALLATPWAFAAGGAEAACHARGLAGLLPRLEPLLEATGSLPVDAIQWLFAMLDPWGIARKFRAFARLDPASPRATLFVALEDWLNDGIPLAAPVARECMAGWYGRNEPGSGRWQVAGQAVDPAALQGPAFLAIPQNDRIVPPASALALATRMPGAHIHMTPAGHIGMAAGGGAEAALWSPLLRWLTGL